MRRERRPADRWPVGPSPLDSPGLHRLAQAVLDAGLEVVIAGPGLIALLAAHGTFGPVPDLAISGINRGINVGQVILHSGTVGAALTAGVKGSARAGGLTGCPHRER